MSVGDMCADSSSNSSHNTNATSAPTGRMYSFSKLHGVGPATLNRLMNRAGVREADLDRLASWEPTLGRALDLRGALEDAEEKAARDFALSKRLGSVILSPLDSEYPPLLATTPDRPPFLFVQGSVETLRTVGISVIGTREPTRHGRIVARRLSTYFAGQGWPIVSGLALGIDSIAHEAALDAGGDTIAVVAHGLDIVYPKRNENLAARIRATGVLVSEYPPGTKPFPAHFVQRDRIQAGLAAAVVLVQTDVKGGSLHASRAALRYGRCLAVPAPTKRDIADNQPKINGILKILHDPPSEVARFLHCNARALRKVITLESRNDYVAFRATLEKQLHLLTNQNPPPEDHAAEELTLWTHRPTELRQGLKFADDCPANAPEPEKGAIPPQMSETNELPYRQSRRVTAEHLSVLKRILAKLEGAEVDAGSVDELRRLADALEDALD